MRLYCLLLVVSCLAQVWGQSSSCSGAFDFIFVIDSSLSLGNHYTESVIPFVESVSNNFINPDFRLCFITFSTPPAVVHLPLTPTEDREAVLAAIESMRGVELKVGTDLPRALDVAIDQIETSGGESVRVILVITDGTWVGLIKHRVKELEMLDVLRFAIGIGNSIDREELLSFVDSKEHLFVGSNFQYLQEIIDLVINKTCVEVTSITPRRLCTDRNTTDIVLLGRGFTINLDRSQAGCRFRSGDGSEDIVTRPVGTISWYRMVCEDPGITTAGEIELQVTLDGEAYITSNIKVVVSDCKDEEGGGGEIGGGGGGGGGGRKDVDVGLVLGLLFGLIGLILLILLCCLWLCFPLITCKIVGGLPPEPEEKEPEPKPGRKWDIVDASYYGGGGVGGIKPVTVRWGKGGSTEEGNKLTKAKDAEVMEVVEEPGVPAPPPKTPPGCWERFKKKVKRMYAVASSYRPVWGPTKRIMWFPGTKPEQTANHTHKSKPSPAPLRTESSSAYLFPDDSNVLSPVRSPPPPPGPGPARAAPPPPSNNPARAPPPPLQHTSRSTGSRGTGRAPPPRPPALNKPPIPSRPPSKPIS